MRRKYIPQPAAKKARNWRITESFLEERTRLSFSFGYPKQKWITFCEALISKGYKLWLYEAKSTVSKYITIGKDKRRFKVRFSNHKPNSYMEKVNDCDFYVGISNSKVTTTEDALKAVFEFFGEN